MVNSLPSFLAYLLSVSFSGFACVSLWGGGEGGGMQLQRQQKARSSFLLFHVNTVLFNTLCYTLYSFTYQSLTAAMYRTQDVYSTMYSTLHAHCTVCTITRLNGDSLTKFAFFWRNIFAYCQTDIPSLAVYPM
jgi:hypothetical protein